MLLFDCCSEIRWRLLLHRLDFVSGHEWDRALFSQSAHRSTVVLKCRIISMGPFKIEWFEQDQPSTVGTELIEKLSVIRDELAEALLACERFDLAELDDHHGNAESFHLVTPAPERVRTPAFAHGGLETYRVAVPCEIAKPRPRCFEFFGEGRFKAALFLEPDQIRATREGNNVALLEFDGGRKSCARNCKRDEGDPEHKHARKLTKRCSCKTKFYLHDPGCEDLKAWATFPVT